jgi:hypothetical protein
MNTIARIGGAALLAAALSLLPTLANAQTDQTTTTASAPPAAMGATANPSNGYGANGMPTATPAYNMTTTTTTYHHGGGGMWGLIGLVGLLGLFGLGGGGRSLPSV